MIKNSMIPLYQQLADEIRQEIAGGKLKPGDKIMTEAELARLSTSAESRCEKLLTSLWRMSALSADRALGPLWQRRSSTES